MRKCPRCGYKFSGDVREGECPKCHLRQSYSKREMATNTVKGEKIEKINEIIGEIINGIVLATVVAMLLFMVLIFLVPDTWFEAIFSSVSTFGGFFGKFRSIYVLLLMIGIAAIGVALLVFVLAKNLKHKMRIVALIAMLGVYFIGGSFFIKGAFNPDIVTSDAEQLKRAESYTVRTETIPSIYNVLKRDDLLLSHRENNEYDEGFAVSMDFLMVVYQDPFTEEQKAKYTEELIGKGYELRTVKNEDGSMQTLLKNLTEGNTFCMVTIDEDNVTFGCGDGNYEGVLGENLLY